MERCYKSGQVYNKILDLWYSYVVPPSLLVAGTTIVLAAYASIRHTELPLLVYGLFPCVTIGLTVVVFALCYDGILVIRASEDTLSRLQSVDDEEYARAIARMERLAGARRVKALRPAYFNLGSFNKFSMDVPIGIWDEIINQLVFLLTL